MFTKLSEFKSTDNTSIHKLYPHTVYSPSHTVNIYVNLIILLKDDQGLNTWMVFLRSITETRTQTCRETLVNM